MIEGRIQPHNIDAEQSVLGSILIDNQSYYDIQTGFHAEMFFKEAHRKIYRAIESLIARGVPADSVTLVNDLQMRGQLEEIGGIMYLVGLSDTVPTSVYANFYAGIVREKAQYRALISASSRVMQLAYDESEPADQVIQTAGQLLNEVQDGTSATDATRSIMHGWADKYASNIRRGNGERVKGVVFTGIKDVDDMIGGFEPGELIVLAGRPGMGKTVAGLQIAQHEAGQQLENDGLRVRVQSLEMTQEQLMERSISSRTELQYNRVKYGKLGASDLHKVNALPNIPLDIDDRAGLTADELIRVVQRAHRKSPLSLLVIDHMHIVSWRRGSKHNEVVELGYISGAMKRLAKELSIPVVLLAQLSRVEGRPKLTDLRGSGSIEQDADIVIFPYRDSYYTPDSQDFKAEWIIAKRRGGEVGTVDVTWCGAYQKFDRSDRVFR